MDRTATGQGTVTSAGRLEAALDFARRAHEGQRRKQDGRPFIEHPIAVEEVLAARGFDDPVLAAAYLHDTVEKTGTDPAEIEREFGPEVARLVAALSEDAAIEGYAERKRALRGQALAAGRTAAIVYTADRLCNLRDWRGLSESERRGAAERLGTTLEERILLWGEDLEDLHELDPQLPFLEEVELELRALRSERRA